MPAVPGLAEEFEPAGDFVVETGTPAELATSHLKPSVEPLDSGPVPLASNFEYLDNPAVSQTGEAWNDDRLSVSLEPRADLDVDIIEGVAVEEGPDWVTAVSQPAKSSPPRAAVPALESAPPKAIPPPPSSAPLGPVRRPSQTEMPAIDTLLPVAVEGEHRVIIHTLEGQVKRGTIRDERLGEALVHYQVLNGSDETLPRERVKALFFLLAPGRNAPSGEGDRVRVTFNDGRQVAGFSKDHRDRTAGFFVIPADNRTNTERIFIFRHAAQTIALES